MPILCSCSLNSLQYNIVGPNPQIQAISLHNVMIRFCLLYYTNMSFLYIDT